MVPPLFGSFPSIYSIFTQLGSGQDMEVKGGERKKVMGDEMGSQAWQREPWTGHPRRWAMPRHCSKGIPCAWPFSAVKW